MTIVPLSEPVLVAIIVGIPATLVALGTLIVGIRTTRRAEVKAAVRDQAIAAIADTGEKTHILVNSSFSAQLKISALALRRIADLTKHPDDEDAAKVAERLFHEHEQKQATVDQGDRVIPGATAQAKPLP